MKYKIKMKKLTAYMSYCKYIGSRIRISLIHGCNNILFSHDNLLLHFSSLVNRDRIMVLRRIISDSAICVMNYVLMGTPCFFNEFST